MIELLRQHFPDLDGVRVSVLGLAFKPGTDDVRESPALPIISELVASGALVCTFDPIAGEAAQRALGIALDHAPDLEQALRGAQAVLVLTRWDGFKQLPRLLATLPEPPMLTRCPPHAESGRVAQIRRNRIQPQVRFGPEPCKPTSRAPFNGTGRYF